MCKFKSGIILKNKVVLAPEGNESHSDLLESLGIDDTRENASKVFVRAELSPPDWNKARPINEWKFNVDQDIVPDWFSIDSGRYEEEFRKEVAEHIAGTFEEICGHAWTAIKREGDKTWYLLDGILTEMNFGKNNNYKESDIRKYVTGCVLAKNLKKEFGKRLVPISNDLTSLDGLKDYGSCNEDIISIMNLDLYRECRDAIPKIDRAWWLSTPNSTPSGRGSDDVRDVCSGGDVCCYGCDWNDFGVRPFFILES